MLCGLRMCSGQETPEVTAWVGTLHVTSGEEGDDRGRPGPLPALGGFSYQRGGSLKDLA